ncbi:hypothetical protein MSAN_00736300 [Mycena sanguinolenta]|uniref:Uncharacterized protein n=1 Tax=Mycena sanguinolenta TaxID=230812 RepID=A0A8H7DGY1_9AGAR|nr:hypothetical protein MSAN_00736300 [Mycena sanguinolenta]
MTTRVPLSAISTSRDDDAPLTRKLLFPQDGRVHRDMEYLWGLDAYTMDPTHERSILHIRRSMQIPFPNGSIGSWALVPTEETLVAMQALQRHNIFVPIPERRSFLTEFSAAEYEYIFVPLHTDVDFYISRPGQEEQRFSAPYTDFPRITSSANPFFVTFDSRLKIGPSLFSENWNMVFGRLTIHWHCGVIPDEFFVPTCYPETFYSLSADEENATEPDAEQVFVEPEPRPMSDEVVVDGLPVDPEGMPRVRRQAERVRKWVQSEAERVRTGVAPSNPPRRIVARADQRKKFYETVRGGPQWRGKSKRGKAHCIRLFYGPPLKKSKLF